MVAEIDNVQEEDIVAVEEEKEEEKKEIPQEKYDLLVWTPFELLFRQRIPLRNKFLSEVCVPFSISLHVKLKRSVFGTYLQSLNETQIQNGFINENKLQITKKILNEFSADEKNWYDYNNNLLDFPTRFLKPLVMETEEIGDNYFNNRVTNLRLDDYNVR